MRRKTRYGFVEIDKETWRENHGIGYDEPAKDITLEFIVQKLDALIELRGALADVEDDYEFDKRHSEFLEYQASIVDLLAPVLDRLTNAGTLLCELSHRPDEEGYRKMFNFWSESGHGIKRGYVIRGSKLDSISDPPPDLISSLDGEEGFLKYPAEE